MAPLVVGTPRPSATVQVTDPPEPSSTPSTEEVRVTVEVTKAPVGSAERPIQLLFPPVAPTDVVTERGAVLAEALQQATGYHYQVGVLDGQQAVVALMCAAPAETIGFLSALGYVLARKQCGVEPASVALGAEGYPWHADMVVVRRDSGIQTLADLADKRLAVSDEERLAILHLQAQLQIANVTVSETVSLAGDSATMLAVYEGDVDAATGVYTPPIMPVDEPAWAYGDDPEVWRALGLRPTRSPIGYVLVLAEPENGGYRLRDARARVFDIAPGIFSETRILQLSAPLPNDTIALGGRLPVGIARRVVSALNKHAASAPCRASLCAADFYGWTGLTVADDSDYEPLRFMSEALSLSEITLWRLAQE